MRALLVESYINSETFTGIGSKVNYCKQCTHDPNYWDWPPRINPRFGNPRRVGQERKGRRRQGLGLPRLFIENRIEEGGAYPRRVWRGGWGAWGWEGVCGKGAEYLFRGTKFQTSVGQFFSFWGVKLLTYSWSFLLIVQLLCSQSVEVLLRRAFPL